MNNTFLESFNNDRWVRDDPSWSRRLDLMILLDVCGVYMVDDQPEFKTRNYYIKYDSDPYVNVKNLIEQYQIVDISMITINTTVDPDNNTRITQYITIRARQSNDK